MSSSSEAKVSVVCPACGASYSVKVELAGRSAKCRCGAKLKIPVPQPVVDEDEYELEPPVSPEVQNPYVWPVTAAANPPTAAKATKSTGGTFNAKLFVGVFGILIMGLVALSGVTNIICAIAVALRPNFPLVGVPILFAVVAFNSLVHLVFSAWEKVWSTANGVRSMG